MIYERPIFIFTCIISSALVPCLVGETTESKNVAVRSASSALSIPSLPASVEQKKRAANYVSPASLSNQSILVISQSDRLAESPPQPPVSKPWLILSLIVTSGLFLLSLWVLFRQNDLEKADTDKGAIQQSNVESPKVLDLKQPNLSPKSVPSLVTVFDAEKSEELTIVEKAQALSKRRIHPNLTIGEEPQAFASEENPVQVNSGSERMVKIVTSKTTEIDVVFELIQDLLQKDRHLRRKAIWELARVGDSRSIEPLVDIMPEADSLDKSMIVSAITQIIHRNFESIHDVLFASLENADPEVRNDAIRDIAALHEPTSAVNQRLSVMLKDADGEVRKTARWALNRIDSGFSLAQSYGADINDIVSSESNINS